MSSIPPLSEIVDASVRVVIPAFAVSSLTAGVLPKSFGRRAEPVAAAIAFIVGVAAANYFRGCFTFRFQPDLPLSPSDLIHGFIAVLTGQPAMIGGIESDPIFAPKAGRYWIPFAILVAGCGSLIVQLLTLPRILKQILRFAAAAIAARMFVPAALQEETPWLIWTIAILIVCHEEIAERISVRCPAQIPTTIWGLCSFAAAIVLIHAHSARLTDVATLIAFATWGIVITSFVCPFRLNSAIPLIAVSLIGTLVSGKHETFSEVPLVSFALPALAPLAIGLLLLIPQRFQIGWKGWASALLLAGIPLTIAVAAAARAETLDFGLRDKRPEAIRSFV